jgi:hypothetical protein
MTGVLVRLGVRSDEAPWASAPQTVYSRRGAVISGFLITQDCSTGNQNICRAGNLDHWRSTDQYDTVKQVTVKRQFVQVGSESAASGCGR